MYIIRGEKVHSVVNELLVAAQRASQLDTFSRVRKKPEHKTRAERKNIKCY